MPFPLSDTDDGFIESHFERRQFRWDEDYFLAVLEHPRSKHDVYWAAIALRKVGTEKSIEPLRALLTFPMQDVKCVAILTIAHVARERATPILSQALLDRKRPVVTPYTECE
jgi:HEAT repeat protein